MSEICTQEENIGFIKGKLESIHDKFDGLDKRLNGAFDCMAKHCEQSDKYRTMIEKHSVYFKIVALITVPIVIYIIKEVIGHIVTS